MKQAERSLNWGNVVDGQHQVPIRDHENQMQLLIMVCASSSHLSMEQPSVGSGVISGLYLVWFELGFCFCLFVFLMHIIKGKAV